MNDLPGNRPAHQRPADTKPSLKDLTKAIQKELGLAQKRQRQSLLRCRNAGRNLLEARKVVHKKQWIDWLKSNFGLTRMTAHNYMRIAENWDKCQKARSLREALKLLRPAQQDHKKTEHEIANDPDSQIEALFSFLDSLEQQAKALRNRLGSFKGVVAHMDNSQSKRVDSTFSRIVALIGELGAEETGEVV